MDELRVVRREDQSLIVATDAGEEFRLVVDGSVLAEIRQLTRRESSGPRVSPRQIQSLVRAGKSRAEIIELTGADESDIERYEEPVLAERQFILSTAQAVPVRTTPGEEANEQFGTVIAERLVGIDATDIEWLAWRDEEAGWMIGLSFVSREVSHRAVWSFDHRKSLLSPINPDAVNLSKQGEVGDRLIPKLRAVDTPEAAGRFDSGAFAAEELPGAVDEDDQSSTAQSQAAVEAALRAGHPSTGSIPIISDDMEYSRRREIDQRAINTPDEAPLDLGQTADLLNALRRRRDSRDTEPLAPETREGVFEGPSSTPPVREIRPVHAEPTLPLDQSIPGPVPTTDTAPPHDGAPTEPRASATDQQTPEGSKRKRRTSIPSWDDILFGTRSEEDPS